MYRQKQGSIKRTVIEDNPTEKRPQKRNRLKREDYAVR